MLVCLGTCPVLRILYPIVSLQTYMVGWYEYYSSRRSKIKCTIVVLFLSPDSFDRLWLVRARACVRVCCVCVCVDDGIWKDLGDVLRPVVRPLQGDEAGLWQSERGIEGRCRDVCRRGLHETPGRVRQVRQSSQVHDLFITHHVVLQYKDEHWCVVMCNKLFESCLIIDHRSSVLTGGVRREA